MWWAAIINKTFHLILHFQRAAICLIELGGQCGFDISRLAVSLCVPTPQLFQRLYGVTPRRRHRQPSSPGCSFSNYFCNSPQALCWLTDTHHTHVAIWGANAPVTHHKRRYDCLTLYRIPPALLFFLLYFILLVFHWGLHASSVAMAQFAEVTVWLWIPRPIALLIVENKFRNKELQIPFYHLAFKEEQILRETNVHLEC